jgi:hypothetical protein
LCLLPGELACCKTKIDTKEHNIRQTLTYASETSILRKRDRKLLKVFKRKVHRRIQGPVYKNGNENYRILTDIEIYAIVKIIYHNRQ